MSSPSTDPSNNASPTNGITPSSPHVGVTASDSSSIFAKIHSNSSFTSSRMPKGNLDKQKPSSASLRQRKSSRKFSVASLSFAHVDSRHSFTSQEVEMDTSQVPWWTSHRLRLALLCFSGFVCLYAQRVNLSIAIVSMVDKSHLNDTGSNNSVQINMMGVTAVSSGYGLATTEAKTTHKDDDEECPTMSNKQMEGEFAWDKKLTGLILGAFFWGYLVLQVVGGRVSERLGATRVITLCMFPVAILNLLTPVVARTSPYLLIVLRVFVGLGESVMYPAAQALWSNWAPPYERSRLIGFSFAGGQFGCAIIFPIGGLLCAYGADGGWPTVFYFIGTVGFVWCIFWAIFAHDTPDKSPGIGELEKKYIKMSIGPRGNRKDTCIPWKSILTSKAFWAILVAQTCGNYGIYMLLTKIPAYMKEVLKFDIKSNGMFSMLPYLAFWAMITLSGMVADSLIDKEILSIKNTRKIMTTIGMVGPAVFLVGTGFMTCNQSTGAVIMLTVSVGLCGVHFSGHFINHADIAPAYAGTLFGMTNTVATIPGILSPYIVSAMTPHGTQKEWQSAFYVAAAIYVFGAIWYDIFGEGDVQPWAESDNDDTAGDEEQDVGFSLRDIHEMEEKEVEEEDDNVKGKNLLNSIRNAKNGTSIKDMGKAAIL